MTVLLVSTLAFTVCFAVWMMFGVTGIPIRAAARPRLDPVRAAHRDAGPDRRAVPPAARHLDRPLRRPDHHAAAACVCCAVPLWISSYATALWQFLLLGLALGLVGASFSVGTPYVARFFPQGAPRVRHGFFGAGTIGAALNMFVAPCADRRYGWQIVPKVYAVALLVTAVLFWIFPRPIPAPVEQAAVS